MKLNLETLTLPLGPWAAIGTNERRPVIGIFRGSELVETLTGSAVQDDPALFLAHATDVELVAVQGRAAKLPWSRADSPFEESRFVLLDEWSALLGIRPPNCSGRLDPVVERLSSVMDRLAELDASVLERSDTYYGWRRSGDQLLIRAAAAHSRARHGQGSTVPPELAFLKHREKPERLKRIKNAPRVDPNEIRDAFDPTGELARRYVNWEPRLQQQQLAGEIAARLRDGGELVAEAGTGTGKSLAYLVPALAHAMQTGEQVVVATNTRVLQGQLASKDAPVAVQAANAQHPDQLPVVQVLKGRGNYLCLRRWFTEVQSGPTPIDDEAAFRAKVNIWLSITESGEQSELPLDRGGGALFNRVSADGEACDAARCQFQQRNQCFLYRARRAAESAHVVITNHALLLTDVVKEGEALPDSRHLIIDEAHHLEDQATKSFQTANSNRLLNTVLNMLAGDGRRGTAGLIPDIDFLLGDFRIVRQNSPGRESAVAQVREIERSIEKIRASASQFFADLAGTIERMGERSREYANRLRVTPTVRNSAEWQAIERRWDELNLPLASLVSHIASLQSGLPDVISSATGGDDGDDEVFTRTEDVVNRLGVVRHELTRMALEMNDAIFNPKADQVYWLESRPGDRLKDAVLYSAPLDLSDYLKRHLYSRLDSLVLTSATMTTGGNARFIRRRLGLEDADEVLYSSPFDFASNSMIIVPTDLPEPNQAGFDLATHASIFDTARAADGRTLVLFTSLAAMNAARAALADRFAEIGLTLVTQHEDGSADQLAERLRSFERTVVFGAGAFWEGVDVPGPALSALVIAKLPFPVPTDPVYAARAETFDNGWTEYTMPQTILKVRQGFGRLIRTQADRGVCVMLDRRLISKRYGAQILDSLPPARREYCTISQVGHTVDRFLSRQE